MKCASVKFFCAFALSLLVSMGFEAQANQNWKVTNVKGGAYIAKSGTQSIKVTKDATLKPGQVLTTNNRTKLTLVRGAQSIQVGPSARMAISSTGQSSNSKTTINLGKGRLDVVAKKGTGTTIAIKGPDVAATAGTSQFSIDVRGGKSKVQAKAGHVEVANLGTGEIEDLIEGQSVTVERGRDGTVIMTVKGSGKPGASSAGRRFVLAGKLAKEALDEVDDANDRDDDDDDNDSSGSDDDSSDEGGSDDSDSSDDDDD